MVFAVILIWCFFGVAGFCLCKCHQCNNAVASMLGADNADSTVHYGYYAKAYKMFCKDEPTLYLHGNQYPRQSIIAMCKVASLANPMKYGGLADATVVDTICDLCEAGHYVMVYVVSERKLRICVDQGDGYSDSKFVKHYGGAVC